MILRLLIIMLILVAVFGLFYLFDRHSITTPILTSVPTSAQTSISTATENIPIANAKGRITKKPFGIFVSPQNSPVSPEKFTGYHTGVDFETFPNKENGDVPIYAICDGKLLEKRTASGYGGVAVESCILNGQPVTVIYGHLKLASIEINSGATFKRGDKIGILGKGYSIETDGEREHLHLGIHKGTAINILGYVQKSSDLSSWLDPTQFPD